MDKQNSISFFKTLTQNGWKPIYNCEYVTEDTYKLFTLTLIGKSYESKCFAHIAESAESLQINGHLGVAWINVEYEYNDRPLGYSDLEDMKEAINCAEKNLLAIGIPFQDNDCFHGTKAEIQAKIRRNNEIRKKLGIDEIEENIRKELYGYEP